MDKRQLSNAVSALKTETHDALQLVVDELNQGQRKKIVKSENVKKLFDRYGVDYGK